MISAKRTLRSVAYAFGLTFGCAGESNEDPTGGNTMSQGMTPQAVAGGSSPPPVSPVMTPTVSPPASGVAGASAPVTAGVPSVRPIAGSGPAPTASGMGIPCDVATIVSDHCASCHAATPRAAAPMGLMTLADFHAVGRTDPSKKMHTLASTRLNHAEVARRMPPPGTVEALQPAELTAFTRWLDTGAAGVSPGCAVVDPETKTPKPGAMAPAPTKPGTFLEPYVGWDEGVECFDFLAHAPGNKTAKYMVGRATDTYIGFGFKPPWEGVRYARAFKLKRDNDKVLHHWLFFEQQSAQDGSVQPLVGVHPDGQLLHGWAPGGGDLYFSKDIGVEMSSSKNYLLEIHYNSTDANAQDASGVQVCVSKEPPVNKTILSWLGTDAITSTSATGTCDPVSNQRIHIVAGTPHMHLKGTHMKVVINRANGMKEVVHDEPFSFENQRVYPEDLWIEPGDTITTTCTYNQPATFGPGTNEEMCYWFAMHYPPLALVDNGPLGKVIHGPNVCLGL